jgi:hypothetical protein
MPYPRNMKYFETNRIIYRRDPINDSASEEYDWGYYFECGTYECYRLFQTKAKINTFKSLRWHILTIWYLNPQMTQDDLERMSNYMCAEHNGFTTFKVSEHVLKNIIYEVSMCDLEQPPQNKLRKIIFRDYNGLTLEEKMKVVGKFSGRSKIVHQDDIYQVMLDIHDLDKKITVTSISKLLGCSTKTIHRNMGEELKREKELLNQQL